MSAAFQSRFFLACCSLLIAGASTVPAAFGQSAIKNVSFVTKSAIILMPCRDKSGNQVMGMTTENEFCTETFNQLVRDGGAKTLSWFKVNAELQKIIDKSKKSSASANPFLSGSSFGASRGDYTNDSYIPELIKAAKALGAKYVVRPVILNKESTQVQENKVSMGFMGFGAGVSRESKKKANATVKLDVISVPEQDIIATKTFVGDISVSEKGGSGYEVSAYAGASGMDAPTRTAMTEAINKAVEYLSTKIE